MWWVGISLSFPQSPLYNPPPGVSYFKKEEWGPCVYHLEGAISFFLHTTNLCRAQCAYPYDKPAVSHKVNCSQGDREVALLHLKLYLISSSDLSPLIWCFQVSDFLSAAQEIVKDTAICRSHCYEDIPLRPFSQNPYLASILEYLQFCQYNRKCGKVWESLGKCWKVWESVGKCWKVWESMGRFGKVWESVGRFGKVWESMGRFGKV